MRVVRKVESLAILQGIVLALVAGVFGTGLSQDIKLPQSRIAEAVTRGKQFKSRAEFLAKGLAPKRFKITGDAQVTLYGDADVISAAVAEANQKMRELTGEEIGRIPQTGLLFANVEIRVHRVGIGGRPSRKSLTRYMDGGGHLVLKIDDEVVQPVAAGVYPSPPKSECYQTMYLWSVFGSFNFAVGGTVPVALPCATQGPDRIAIEFGFRLRDAQWRPAEVILIDRDGNRQKVAVDLSKLR